MFTLTMLRRRAQTGEDHFNLQTGQTCVIEVEGDVGLGMHACLQIGNSSPEPKGVLGSQIAFERVLVPKHTHTYRLEPGGTPPEHETTYKTHAHTHTHTRTAVLAGNDSGSAQ